MPYGAAAGTAASRHEADINRGRPRRVNSGAPSFLPQDSQSLRSVEDLKSDQAINAPHIVLALELDDLPLAFLLGPPQKRVPRFHEFVEGHTEATGILDARKTDANDGAHAELAAEALVDRREVWIVGFQHLARP